MREYDCYETAKNRMLNFEGCSAWSIVILPRFIDIDWPQQLLFNTNQRKSVKITGKDLTVSTELSEP
jgi:hypothetical protein